MIASPSTGFATDALFVMDPSPSSTDVHAMFLIVSRFWRGERYYNTRLSARWGKRWVDKRTEQFLPAGQLGRLIVLLPLSHHQVRSHPLLVLALARTI